MIKLLIGGSPCTKWSIAQKNGRETEPSGIGWELFLNYLIAKQKFKPDFFLYENNKSASQAIKDQIATELGVDLMYINSALVPAQNRQRFYAFNWTVEQPEDRGILLRDILESGENLSSNEKSYALTTRCAGAIPEDTIRRRRHTMVAEPIRIPPYGNDDKARPLNSHYSNNCGGFEHRMFSENPNKQQVDMIAEPIVPFVEKRLDDAVAKYGYIPEMWNPYNNSEITDKAPTQMTNCGSQTVSSTVLMCEPVGIGYRGRMEDGKWVKRYESNGEPKANAITTAQTDSMVCEPVRIGTIESDVANKDHDSKQYRVYSPDGKATTLCGQGGGVGAKTGLYACPMVVTEATKKGYAEIQPGECVDLTFPNSKTRRGRRMSKKANCLTTASSELYEYCGTVDKPIYEVKDGFIVIKGKQYPIKLKDGYYIIRKLTVTECFRLQTLPDDYCRAVSNSQAYKGLGNGWTAEVIIHILNGALKDVPRDEEIVVLSMYDGIGTGRYCLDKMGFTNVKYYAYEIDKYAKQVAMSNYPDIIQCGDAFDLRHPDWTIGY